MVATGGLAGSCGRLAWRSRGVRLARPRGVRGAFGACGVASSGAGVWEILLAWRSKSPGSPANRRRRWNNVPVGWTRTFAGLVGLVAAILGLAAISGSGVAAASRAVCPHPTVPVPRHEPVYRPGPTELLSGLYIQGGAVPQPPCKPKPRGPYAGKITVTNPETGAVVATKSVKNGHLAHIGLPAGIYNVSGQISGGGPTLSASGVKVRKGYKVRQDLFEDVP